MRIEIIKDRGFKNGFTYAYSDKDSNSKKYLHNLFEQEGKIPNWRIAQWWSKFPIDEKEPVKLREGCAGYRNDGITLILENGDYSNVLTMHMDTENEYKDYIRKDGDGFPHILATQIFEGLPKIHEMHSLTVSYTVRISACENKMKPKDYIPSKHCAHVVSYFAVKNKNSDKESYGEYFWFGMPVFDSRWDFPKEFRAKDGSDDKNAQKKGTGMYIYTMCGEKLWSKPIGDGNWHSFEKNVLPLMLEGFSDAKQKGYLKDAELKDMELFSYNIGWEIPGTFNAGVQLKNIFAECEV